MYETGLMHPGPCVGCSCTAERACLGLGDVPCHWADEHAPLCSVCAFERAQPGAKVKVLRGPRRGRVGAVKRVPKQFPACPVSEVLHLSLSIPRASTRPGTCYREPREDGGSSRGAALGAGLVLPPQVCPACWMLLPISRSARR